MKDACRDMRDNYLRDLKEQGLGLGLGLGQGNMMSPFAAPVKSSIGGGGVTGLLLSQSPGTPMVGIGGGGGGGGTSSSSSSHMTTNDMNNMGEPSGDEGNDNNNAINTLSDADVARLIKERLRKKLKSILRPPTATQPSTAGGVSIGGSLGSSGVTTTSCEEVAS